MQVAAMLERDLKARRQHRTFEQKWGQMRAARALESTWSKRQILASLLESLDVSWRDSASALPRARYSASTQAD